MNSLCLAIHKACHVLKDHGVVMEEKRLWSVYLRHHVGGGDLKDLLPPLKAGSTSRVSTHLRRSLVLGAM